MTIKEVVLEILTHDIKARGNDNYLILKVYEKFGWSTDLKDIAENGENHFESIRRWRAKLQQTNPFLKPSKQIQLFREVKEEQFYNDMRGI